MPGWVGWAVAAALMLAALAVNPHRACWHPRHVDRLARMQMVAVAALALAAVASAL